MGESFLHGLIKYLFSKHPINQAPLTACHQHSWGNFFIQWHNQQLITAASHEVVSGQTCWLNSPYIRGLSDLSTFIAQQFDLKTYTHSHFSASCTLECTTFRLKNELQFELINKKREINDPVGMLSICCKFMSRITMQNVWYSFPF